MPDVIAIGLLLSGRNKKLLFLDNSNISDECITQQFVPRHMHIRRLLDKRFDKKYVVCPMKRPPSQMIGDAMACRDAAGLYCIPPQTAHARPQLHDLHARWRSLSRSKVASEFLKKNKISVLEWPGNSADLNPIENLWTVMKDKVAYKQPPIVGMKAKQITALSILFLKIVSGLKRLQYIYIIYASLILF